MVNQELINKDQMNERDKENNVVKILLFDIDKNEIIKI